MPGILSHDLADTGVRITRVKEKASRKFNKSLPMGRCAWHQADRVRKKCPQVAPVHRAVEIGGESQAARCIHEWRVNGQIERIHYSPFKLTEIKHWSILTS